MYILALDTTSSQGGVVLLKDNEVLEANSWQAFSNHSAALAFNTHQILEKFKLKVNDLDAIGVCTGPGSYTGIRVVLSFVKGLAALSSIPIVRLSSLDLLAYQNRDLSPLAVCLDARNAEVYAKFFEKNFQLTQKDIQESCLSFKDFFVALESKISLSEVFWLGSGAIANAYFLREQGVQENKILPLEKSQLDILSLAQLSFECYQQKLFLGSVLELQGNYLRDFRVRDKGNTSP
ncbi:MAG: tRNA (adenosine(37)-N6)-threonylcarbamoyltransferase complex dimerization subunit type 1 TsaB [Deltaproteobacteria bacterium]|nr:tRNA (adenosine(37)-N6)-threonylcarbamoyltransferase complex dimerization subunit type 1 TsaB [Deltaproteobacteria bacterium]